MTSPLWNFSAVCRNLTLIFGVSLSVFAGETDVDFEKQIWPILQSRCVSCHGSEAAEGGLRLTDAAFAFARVDSGEFAITPGDLSQSTLWTRVTNHDEDVRMPPEGEPLEPHELALIRNWIASGARWTSPSKATTHWAFVAPQKPALPPDASGWARNEIDRFVLARMKSQGLRPSDEAEPARLIRRLYLDLIGLPPSVDEVNRFAQDPSDAAYARIVDRLLSSPRYGEKWARHWLDLARYSDSNGYQADQIREMWAFRDWVIHAMNDDMPYDQFTIEQLAGDLLPNATLDQQIATGFHRATTCNVEAGVDPEGNRTDQVIDRVNTTGTTWLGMTVSCAQCHNHKYDPITQQEYYELFAFFNNTPIEVKQDAAKSVSFSFYGPKLPLPEESGRVLRRKELSAQIEKIDEQIAAHKKAKKKSLLARVQKQKRELASELDRLAMPTTLVMQEMGEPRDTSLLIRGDFLHPGDRVQAGVPAVLHDYPDDAPRNRLGLARWMVDPNNPLTARVAVNRWWYEFFGRGIVTTLDDFGTQGDRPTHTELLDWLAIWLQENDWSMKATHRLIANSSTYRQTAKVNTSGEPSDPDNRWLARGPRNRLTAELIRDNALAISGLLVNQMDGPPIYPPQPDGLWHQTGRNEPVFHVAKDHDRHRRAIYVVWRRAAPYPSFINFDAPDRMTCVAKRPNTNTPLQALTLLNDEVYVEIAKAMAIRIMREASDRSLDSQLEYAMQIALARSPTAEELSLLRQLFDAEYDELGGDRKRVAQLVQGTEWLRMPVPDDRQTWGAWFSVCNAILNLDETISK